jgi:WD40 repeat protein
MAALPSLRATPGWAVAWTLQLLDHVSALSVSPDGRLLVAGSLGGDTVVANTMTGSVTAKLAEHPLGVLCAGWAPDGSRVAVGGQDGVLAIADPDGHSPGVYRGDGWVSSLAWSPPGDRIAAAIGRSVVVMDVDATVTATYPDHPSTVTCLAWAPNGRRVAAGCYGGVAVYDPVRDAGPVRRLAWKGSLLALAYSPDGKWLVSGNQDASVHLWRLANTEELEMSGYAAKVEHLAFDPTGRWLAVAGVGETSVWDMAGKGPSGRRPTSLAGHARRVTALAWDTKGVRLATGSADGFIAIWRPARAAQPEAVVDAQDTVTQLVWLPGDDAILAATGDGRVFRAEHA